MSRLTDPQASDALWGPDLNPAAYVPGQAEPIKKRRHGRRVARFIGVFLLGAISGIGAFMAIASSEEPTMPFASHGKGGDLSTFRLSEGQCAVGELEGGKPLTDDQSVPCSASHNLEVYGEMLSPAVEGASYDIEALSWFADAGCDSAFEPYVKRDYMSSDLDYLPVIPSKMAWAEGERRLFCVLFPLDGHPFKGSARGSRH